MTGPIQTVAFGDARRIVDPPLTYTTGALSPVQVLDALDSLIATEANMSSVPVGLGFLAVLRDLAMTFPLDQLAALRAERTLETQRVAA